MFAVSVLPEPGFAFLVRDGGASGCADTDGDDKESVLPGFLRNLRRGIDGIFAIAEDDESIGALRGAALEILHGFA